MCVCMYVCVGAGAFGCVDGCRVCLCRVLLFVVVSVSVPVCMCMCLYVCMRVRVVCVPARVNMQIQGGCSVVACVDAFVHHVSV
jgi:hypothetical protein